MRISAWSSDVCSSDLYATPAIHANVKAVFTNTAPVDAYRGAGRPEATYLIERIVECAARELRIDPAEIRRRNFIRPDQFPYQTPVALVYATGHYKPARPAEPRVRENEVYTG